jgi:hypothetical protein
VEEEAKKEVVLVEVEEEEEDEDEEEEEEEDEEDESEVWNNCSFILLDSFLSFMFSGKPFSKLAL